MDLEAAIQKHEAWRMRFHVAMIQHLVMDPTIIAKDNYCELGKWQYGDAKAKYGHLDSFAACVLIHATYHKEAAKVAETINAKNYIEAENMLCNGSSLANTSIEVIKAIMKFKEEAKV